MPDSAIHWTATKEPHPAREASLASMHAVCRKAKDDWLALFAEDGVVEDPVGPSMFDAEGVGHHGHAAIGTFWDTAIAGVERFEFAVRDSFAAGWECANVGTISSFLPGGYRVDAEGVFVYRSARTGSSDPCARSGRSTAPWRPCGRPDAAHPAPRPARRRRVPAREVSPGRGSARSSARRCRR